MQNSDTLDPSHSLRKYKFIKRKLDLNKFYDDQELLLTQARLKGLHFKTIIEGYSSTPNYYSKRKELTSLETLNLAFINQTHLLNVVKNCKILRKINLGILYKFPLQTKIACIKRLPKNIEEINALGSASSFLEIRSLYKSLARFRKLKMLSTLVEFCKEEYVCLNKYLKRLKYLRGVRIMSNEKKIA